MKLKKGFTLVELIVTIAMSSIVLVAISLIFPNVLKLFQEQKQILDFQKKSVIDNTYLFDKITNSERLIYKNSSMDFSPKNSFSMFLNTFNKINLPIFTVSLFDNGWNIFSNSAQKDIKIWVKENIAYSSFIKIWTGVYFTEPWKHTIKKMDVNWNNIVTVFWQNWTSWFDNSWSGIFNTPTWLTYDSTNNILYVADSWNSSIRSIDLWTSTILTYAWIPWEIWYNQWENNLSWTILSQVKLNYPTWLAFSWTSLYISDTFNNRIRKTIWGKMYTILWNDNFWFNWDFLDFSWAYINYPVWIKAFSSWVIFADCVNWKVRYLDENSWNLQTFVWVSLSKNANNYSLDRYIKLDFTTEVQILGNNIYFNDFKNWIIYKIVTWLDWIFWTNDDEVSKILWDFNNNLLLNWDFEKELSSEPLIYSSAESFYKTQNESATPKSWNYYFGANTEWLYSSWILLFTWNPNDWDTLNIGGYSYEFDDWTLSYWSWKIVIPLWSTLNDTLFNFKTELSQNNSINYIFTWTTFSIKNKVVGASSVTFSWASSKITLDPSSWKLEWWLDFWIWTQEFYFDKNLLADEKYELSFYASSYSWVSTDIMDPLIEVSFWTWLLEQKITNLSKIWSSHRFLFKGLWWSWQRIKFKIKNWNKVYFDNVILTSLWTREIEDDIKTFRIDILPWFFLDDSNKFFVTDFNNSKLKFIDISSNSISKLSSFSIFDVKTFSLNAKEDYIWNSLYDSLKFRVKNYTDILSSKIEYFLWYKDNILKLTANIKSKY